MTPQLQQAVENLYAAFGGIRKPGEIDGCPCCIDEKGASILLSKPLRSLTPDDLTHYASSVLLTVGTVDDFLYFLPRILEIVVIDPGWYPDKEVVAMRINDAEFFNWEARYRDALLSYFDAALESAILANDGYEIDSWMCALGKIFSDLSPYLARISSHPQSLIKYYEDNSECLVKGKLDNAFWDDTQETYKQVLAWFGSPEIRELIDKTYGLI